MKRLIAALIVTSLVLGMAFPAFAETEQSIPESVSADIITEMPLAEEASIKGESEQENTKDIINVFSLEEEDLKKNALASWEGKQERKTLLQENDLTTYDTDKTIPFNGGSENSAGAAGMFFSGDGETEDEYSLGIDGGVSGTRVNGGNFTLQNKGKILFEARVRSEGTSDAQICFTGTSDAVRPGISILPKAYADGEWHDMRYIIDLDEGAIMQAVDGGDTVVLHTGIIFSYGLMRFYIANWEASSSKLFIKYINVYQYVTAPVLTSATASNDTGEITEVNEDATIPGGTNKMTFKFDDELVSASQELFSATDTDNGNVIDDYSVTISGKNVELNFSTPLANGAEYRIEIAPGVGSKEGFTSEKRYTFNVTTGKGTVIGELDAEVVSPYEYGDILYENDCSSADKLVGGGVQAGTAGFIAGHSTTYNFTENAMENFGRLDISLGGMHFAPEVIRLSFDLKVSDIQNWSFKPFANTLDGANINVLLKDIPGAKANEWMRLKLEFIPDPTPSKQSLLIQIDDNATKSYTYQCGNRNNISWLRIDGVNGTRYIRNIKIELKRFWYANDCSNEAKVIIGNRENGINSGFYNCAMTSVTNNFVFDKTEKAVKATISKNQSSGSLFNFGSGLETPNGKMKYSFRLKFTEEADLGLNLSWTTNDFDSKTYSLINDFGGEEFKTGEYQKYNVLIDNPNKTVALWRGEDAAMPEETAVNSFACGARPGANAMRIYVKGICSNDAFIYLDDIIVERYDPEYVPTTVVPTSANATIANSTDEPFEAYLIYSTYTNTTFNGTKIKKMTTPQYAKAEQSIDFETSNGTVTDELVYLWSADDLSPMTDYGKIKNETELNSENADLCGAKVDYENHKVTVAGKAEPESDVSIMVFAKDMSFEDISETFGNDVVIYNRQVRIDENGAYAFEFDIDRDSGRYNYYIGTNDGSAMLEGYFDYVSAEDRKSVVDALNGAKDDVNIINKVCTENLFVCGIDEELYSRADSDMAAEIIHNYLQDNNEFSEDNFDEVLNVVGATFEISAIASGKAENSDYVEDAKLYNVMDKNIKKWMTNTTPSDKEKKAIINNLEGSYESFSEFEDAFIENIVINVTAKHSGLQNIKDVIADFEDNIGIDVSKLKNSDYERIMGKTFSSVEELKSALSKKTTSNSSSGGGSTNGNGSSKGSFVSTGKTNASSVEFPLQNTESTVNVEKIMSFADLDSVSWAVEAIAALAREKIISGKSDTVFDPSSSVKREEFAKMAVGVFGYQILPYSEIFGDVSADAWYAGYIATAVQNGICQGIGNGKFGTGADITRQDLCVMVYNGLTKKPEITEGNPFVDEDDISDYAKTAVYALKSAGIINGNEKGEFNPKNSATRAEAAVILYAVLNYLK